MSGRHRGFVLVLTLLLLVALTLLAHGMLAIAQTHRRAGASAWIARARAWSAEALAVAAARGLDSIPSEVRSRDVTWQGGQATLVYKPLSSELVLVEARATAFDGADADVFSGVESRAGGLVWALDPALRVASLPRAAEVGRWPDVGTFSRVDAVGVAVLDEAPCPPDTLAVGRGRPVLALRPAWDTVAAGSPPGLGLLEADTLVGRLGLVPGAEGTPAPVVEGEVCRPDPWNWGDPERPVAACGGRWAAVWWPGDLRLVGGAGQGVLVVGGSLTLADTRFRGLLLVAGDLVLEGAGTVEGVARVGGGLRVGSDALFRGHPCSAYEGLATLARSSALGDPRVLDGIGWSLF
jgi:hypothetical protein